MGETLGSSEGEIVMVPEELSYTKEHEWIKIENGIATIGITDHAQQMLGEITFVELPEIGKEIQPKDELGIIESSKSASDIYSPVAGKVTEVNSQLEDTPELINESCYEKGWMCKLSVTEESTEGLMNAEQYQDYLKEL